MLLALGGAPPALLVELQGGLAELEDALVPHHRLGVVVELLLDPR